jgi:hypothetical protein
VGSSFNEKMLKGKSGCLCLYSFNEKMPEDPRMLT